MQFHCYITVKQTMSSKSFLTEARNALASDLADALVRLKDKDEAMALLADLCTPAEVHTLAERWHVAKLLNAGDLTYREIHEATGVSTTTIVRVARFLRQENNGGYRMLLDRTGQKA
ncbi:YerC/YecD family TrpR-related protein [Sphingomonas sp. LY29]|uniref:YerC/YecD family TrpR-related protein n=1 Tax=Sphingomonas sp. LY29 TaxID=3095341 RepID=UPI002D78A766|nr:YerC/YecD family TrpR-related protein [Sphingomonas sp. LY29]WRP26298.1 YerC/YecD family TrpR-related protein [Sphingomonas sp. LY29]